MTPDKPTGQVPAPNGANAAIATLAQSSNMWVQLATVGLVAVTGMSNFAATWNSSERNKQEIVSSREKIREEVIQQISEMHKWIIDSTAEFHQSTADAAASRKTLMQFKDEVADFERRQIKLLENQNSMLSNDSALLGETHQIVAKLEEMRRLDQMRGAPSQ